MAGGIHKGGLMRLFPYDFLVEQEGRMYVARAAKQGYTDLTPNSTIATLCQQIVTALGGVGSFFLKDLQLPAGVTYPSGGSMLAAELYNGILGFYTNGVPQSGTAYKRTNEDGSIDYLIVIEGKEIVLESEIGEGELL